MKRLSMILRYGATGASSRVRGIELARVMRRRVSILTPDDPSWRRRYYTAAMSRSPLYLQKRASQRDLDVVRLRRRLGLRTVFDIDDAPGGIEEKPEQEALVANIMSAATAVTVGSDRLRRFAAGYDSRVEVIPSAVDTDLYRPAQAAGDGIPTVGWIGNGAAYEDELADLARVVAGVRAHRRIRVAVFGAMGRDGIHARFGHQDDRVVDALAWDDEKAIAAAIAGFDIGVYPLRDNAYNEFKCGYKAIQYMAVGLPVVASPTGENARIIRHGDTGFLAGDLDAWIEHVSALAGDPGARAHLGEAGRLTAEESYSLRGAASQLDALLDDIEGQ